MPAPRHHWRSAAVSLLLLAIAASLAWRLAWRLEKPESGASIAAQLAEFAPHASHEQLMQWAQVWGYTGLSAAHRRGIAGLSTLDTFRDGAGELLWSDPAAFDRLADAASIRPELAQLASGPWSESFWQWARDQRLPAVAQRLGHMSPARWAVARRIPQALPLVITDESGLAVRALSEHGDEAWRILSLVDYVDHPHDAERVARALLDDAATMLDVAARFGPAAALWLVPAGEDRVSRDWSTVVQHTLAGSPDSAVALAWLVANEQTACDALAGGMGCEQLLAAADRFAALPPIVQRAAADCDVSLWLLSQTFSARPSGAQALCHAGPAGARIVYDHFRGEPSVLAAAIAALDRTGPRALYVLSRYRDYAPLRQFLRRAERDGLLRPEESPPLLALAVDEICTAGQAALDRFARVENIRAQILSEAHGPLPQEAYLQWAPGYLAYSAAHKYFTGMSVGWHDAGWAAVDAASSLWIVYGPIRAGLRGLGLGGEQVVAAAAARGAAVELAAGDTRFVQELLAQSESPLGPLLGEALPLRGSRIAGQVIGRTAPAAEIPAAGAAAVAIESLRPLAERRGLHLARETGIQGNTLANVGLLERALK